MADEDPVDKAVELFENNDVAELVMQSVHGGISDEPRTLSGEFPGNRDRAMGHARATAEIAREGGLEAEVEYVEPVEDIDELHRIKVHLNGGDES